MVYYIFVFNKHTCILYTICYIFILNKHVYIYIYIYIYYVCLTNIMRGNSRGNYQNIAIFNSYTSSTQFQWEILPYSIQLSHISILYILTYQTEHATYFLVILWGLAYRAQLLCVTCVSLYFTE